MPAFTGPVYVISELPSGRYDIIFCVDSYGNTGEDTYSVSRREMEEVVRRLGADGAYVQWSD